MKFYKVLIISLLFTNLMAQNMNVSDEIMIYLSKTPKEYIVLIDVVDLKGNEIFKLNETEKVAPASTIKVPIMMCLMELVNQNKIRLEAKYLLKNEDKLEGSSLSNSAEGTAFTIRQLLEYMIIYSDNAATNILIKQIGRKNINEQIRQWGFKDTSLNRIMLDFEAAKNGRENVITCKEANQFLRLIYQKKMANKVLCDEMLSILKRNDDRETIPNKIPKDIEIAHKTGTLDWVRGDVGIVFTNKPFLISIFVKKENGQTIDLKTTEKIIADISEICYNKLK